MHQAEEFNIFDDIYIYNQYTLPKDEQFDKILKDKLKPDIRGFGYWCWKPFVVLKTLENIEYGDILLYADIGCYLSKKGINRFYEYLDIVIENKNMCSEIAINEKMYTKSDLFNYFNVLDDKNITDTFQRPATFFILEKNDANIELVKKWLQVFYDDFSLVDDSPSKIPNLDGFIENRHDQSAFSILSKIYNMKVIKSFEFDSKNPIYPILFMRDKKDIYDFIIEISCEKLIKNICWYISSFKYREMLKKYFKLNLYELINIYFLYNKDFSKFKYIKCNNFILDTIIKLFFKKLKKKLIKAIENNVNDVQSVIDTMSKYGCPFNK
ncbi:hypothetical protein [Brachyspira hampsonii]|uniref:hypothetical protein n=1 Tax=Brachyspira hampsonii TaxID=1287055 RepID=UPI002159FAE1|nr:hypothetical protein [Brachyspira hampsonii]